MEQKFDFDVQVKLKSKKRRRIWQRTLSVMMCLVVFCTTYMLILPAITKENKTFCGIEEHIHNEKCFEKVLLCASHVHTEECFESGSGLICTEPTDDGHTHGETCGPVTETVLVCGLEETEGHVHTENCSPAEEKTLNCGLEETEGHTHGESCISTETVLQCMLEEDVPDGDSYTTVTSVVCGVEESSGHTHGEDCYTVTTAYGCGLEETEEHTHTENCVPVTETILSCDLAETEGHTHTESCTVTETVPLDRTEKHIHGEDCYTTVTSVVCGTEESSGHTHSEDCYTVTTIYGCGLEEAESHTHTDSCYEEVTTYGCGMEEKAPSHIHTEDCYETMQLQVCTTESDPEHEHTDDCYEEKLICELKEHEHTQACFSDPSADLESAVVWEATLPKELSGVYSEDVLKIAESQLGYTESAKNYIVTEDGKLKGYTRYGAWYGSPYGDWCAMFTSFCMHYAGAEEVPLEASCTNWVKKLQEQDLYKLPSEYVPKAGDIIFFDWENDGVFDHVGLVEDVVDADVCTIEGNSGSYGNCVAQNKYELHDTRIAGYGTFSELQIEQTETPVTDIDPEEADALAVLVEPDEELSEELPSEPEEPSFFANTFDLRKMFTLNKNTAKSNDPLDLKDYIQNITMYDEYQNVIPNGSTVHEGDIIEFKIDFVLKGQQMGVMNPNGPDTVYTDTLVFELPENIKVVQGVSDDIINSAGQVVGEFVIDDINGMITMKFDETYVDQNISGMQIEGHISFFSTVTKITDQDDETQQYPFKEGFTLGVVIKEKIEAVGDLRIEKQKVDVAGEEIVYEVRVTSAEGTKGPVIITDNMSKGLTFIDVIEVRKGDGTEVNADFTLADDKNSFKMTLPEMAAGESYIVRYRCAADVDQLGVDMTVRNTASVTGKDSQDNELKDEITVDYTFEMLKKTGVNNGDGTITWTITVNAAKADISGWILEDFVSTAAEINIPYTGPVTIRDSSGTLIQENAALPYVFPDGSRDTYIITYTTSHDLGDGDMIYNRAVLKDDDTDITVVTGTGIGQPLEKTGQAGELNQDADGKYILPITWTVTLNTEIGAIPAGEVLNDKMDSGSANVVYMTYDQLITAIASMKAAVEATGGQTGLIQASVYVPGEGTGASYSFDDLTANADNYRSFLFEAFSVTLDKEVPKGQTVTFTYETYGEFDNNLVKDTAFENHFNISDHYDVNGRVDFEAGAIEATKMAMKPYNPNGGIQDWRLEWNGVEGTSKVNYDALFDSYLAWAIQLDVPTNYIGNGNVVIHEDLPDGVSVKGLDLPFTDSVPTSRLEMRNMVPGETYTWDFKVYPIDQYDVYYEPHRTGAQNVSIVVKVTDSGDLEITVPGVVFELMAAYAAKNNLAQAQTYLFVYTQIDEDYVWTPKGDTAFVYLDVFENRFTIENEDGRVIDIGSQSQEVTMDERAEIIRKEANTTNNNIIEYSVILNSKKKDLVENAATLKVHDELIYTETEEEPLRLRLVPGSVKLYEISMNADGTYTKGSEVKINYSYKETSAVQYGITTWTHTLDLNIPDSKALVLEYNYRATGKKDVMFNIRNTCTVEGLGEGSLDGKHDVELMVKNTAAQADTSGVMLFKVDANSDGVFLENAKFNIYIWNEDAGPNGEGAYIIVNHPDDPGTDGNVDKTDFVTNQSGMIVIDGSTIEEKQFAYNTAYYIVEKESPEGYYLSPEPYYFMIGHPERDKYPVCQPNNFTGDVLSRGDIIYRKNVSATTEISIEKYWKSYNGESIKVTKAEVPSITLELWQKLEGDPDSDKLYDTYTVIPDEEGNWNLSITDLPKATEVQFDPDSPENANVTKGTDYLYYIKEVDVNGFTLESSENNEGINSGIIKIVNRETEGYELPETGGIGTNLYTVGGLLLIATAAILLLYRHLLHRREELSSS